VAVRERFGGRHTQFLFCNRVHMVVDEQAQHLVMRGLPR
jgi:hypothetical protein